MDRYWKTARFLGLQGALHINEIISNNTKFPVHISHTTVRLQKVFGLLLDQDLGNYRK